MIPTFSPLPRWCWLGGCFQNAGCSWVFCFFVAGFYQFPETITQAIPTNNGIIHPVTSLETRGLDYKTQAMIASSRIHIGTHSSVGDLKKPQALGSCPCSTLNNPGRIVSWVGDTRIENILTIITPKAAPNNVDSISRPSYLWCSAHHEAFLLWLSD